MTCKALPAAEAFAEWRKDPTHVVVHAVLEEKLVHDQAFIRARAQADLTQAQVALRMGTTQAVIARLESGRVKPSTRTLERFARATGTRLRIVFEPETAA